MKSPKQPVTEFVIVPKEKKPSAPKVEVEWDNTQHCGGCNRVGSYWIGGNSSLCQACIRGLAKIAKKLK